MFITIDSAWVAVAQIELNLCRFEAKSEDRMMEIQNEILEKLSEFGDIDFDSC